MHPGKLHCTIWKFPFFFSIIPLFRLVLKKVLQKVAVKNLSTKSNAQLLGVKFRCALMRPSRASLAHATVNLISLHWVCCFNWLYIFQLLGGFICKIRVSCHICLLEFFNWFLSQPLTFWLPHYQSKVFTFFLKLTCKIQVRIFPAICNGFSIYFLYNF